MLSEFASINSDNAPAASEPHAASAAAPLERDSDRASSILSELTIEQRRKMIARLSAELSAEKSQIPPGNLQTSSRNTKNSEGNPLVPPGFWSTQQAIFQARALTVQSTQQVFHVLKNGVRCTRCDKIFFDKSTFNHHHSTSHKGKAMQYECNVAYKDVNGTMTSDIEWTFKPLPQPSAKVICAPGMLERQTKNLSKALQLYDYPKSVPIGDLSDPGIIIRDLFWTKSTTSPSLHQPYVIGSKHQFYSHYFSICSLCATSSAACCLIECAVIGQPVRALALAASVCLLTTPPPSVC